MTLKDKIILVLLSFLTFGIYPLIVFRKKQETVKNNLSSSTKISFNIQRLRELLGGENNILGCEYTHTKIKVFLKENKNINLEAIQKLKGVSGLFNTSKSTTIIVGNQAKLIADQL